MPTVPQGPTINISDSGQSMLASPTPENLLMAAASMHAQGAFDKPTPTGIKRNRAKSMKVVG